MIAYSPLGRGFLSGQIKRPEDFAEDDFRRYSPRFVGDNFAKNLRLLDHVETLAGKKGCTPAQLALAWLLQQGSFLVPIPGTKRRKYLEENVGALHVPLSPAECAQLDILLPPGAAAGTRYPEHVMASLNR